MVFFQWRWGRRVAGYKDRFRNKLRRCAFRVEITENTVHTRLRQSHIVLECVIHPDRMVVDEHLKVLADDKRVEQLLVDDIEFLDRIILPRVMYVESEMHFLPGFRNAW